MFRPVSRGLRLKQRYLAWKQLDGNGYVFANAGVAFFDTKMKSRKPKWAP